MFLNGAVTRVLRLLRCNLCQVFGSLNLTVGYPYLSANIRKIIRLMNEVRDHPRNDSVVDCSCPELSELIV